MNPFLRYCLCYVLFALWITGKTFCQTPADFISDDIQLTGTLGQNLQIELQLNGDSKHAFFDLADEPCRDISGSYFYRSQMLPISLKGQICMKGKTIVLYNLNGLVETERFEGKWDSDARKVTGTWTLAKSGKKLPFRLGAVDAGQSMETIKAFYQFVSEQIIPPADAEWVDYQYRFKEIQCDENGVKIVGFEASDARFDHFSLSRLEFTHDYSRAGTGLEDNDFFQLLPIDAGVFVLQVSQEFYALPIFGDDGDEIKYDEGCDYSVQVWQWESGKWSNVSAQAWPPGVATGFPVDDNHPCECVVMCDALHIANHKIYWDGEKFAVK